MQMYVITLLTFRHSLVERTIVQNFLHGLVLYHVFYVAMSVSAVSGWLSNCELRGGIHYLYFLTTRTSEVHCCLCTTYEENNVYKVRTVYYSVGQFAKCRTNLHDSE